MIFMKRAIELSRIYMNQGHGGPFGAVITKGNQIIAEGWNQVLITKDPTAHAEIIAIRIAAKQMDNFDLSGCEIYTSCEPCPMCLGAIYWAKLNKIYFANSRRDAAQIDFNDEFIYDELQKPVLQRKIPMIQIERETAQQIFQEWQIKSDKISY